MSAPRSSRRVGAIVLAAGASTRLGHPKQLIEHEGEPLVRRAATAARDAGADPVLVVVGAYADLVCAALESLTSIETLYNADWGKGLASSLVAGLAALSSDVTCDGALVTVADQPLVDAASLAQLLRGFDNDNRLVASSYNDTLGVPAVIGAEYFGELMKLEGDQGAGKWLRARRANVTQVPVPTASLDIDTPVDAHAFASGLARPKH